MPRDDQPALTWRFATYTGARLAALTSNHNRTDLVLRTATLRMRVSAARHPHAATATLWGPHPRGFLPFIDETLDAVLDVELRRVADDSLLYAASGSHAALEDML